MAQIGVLIPRVEGFLEGHEFDDPSQKRTVTILLYWHRGNDGEGAYHAEVDLHEGGNDVEQGDLLGHGSMSGNMSIISPLAEALHDALNEAVDTLSEED